MVDRHAVTLPGTVFEISKVKVAISMVPRQMVYAILLKVANHNL